MSTPAAQPNPDYVASLGLQRAPFLDQIDDRFFYADPLLVQRLDLLQHLTQFGDMLLGVSGPAGSGKSTLLQQLLQRGGGTWRCCRLNGGHLHQPGELLIQLADCFGLDRNAAPDQLKSELLRLCQTLRHNAQTAVIVIDDAHLLPDPALKTLLELGGHPRETLKLLRVILFSEPGLEQRLFQAGWHSPLQPLLHNLDMPVFDDRQTAAYLMYRLAVAGYSGDSPFSLTEIRALHKAAGGLPSKLNVLAHELLMERASRIAARKGAASSTKTAAQPDAARRPRRIAGMAAGVAALGALGWYLTRPIGEPPADHRPMTESAPAQTPEHATPAAPETGPDTASPPEPEAATSPQPGPTAADNTPATPSPGTAETADTTDHAPGESGAAPDISIDAGTPPAETEPAPDTSSQATPAPAVAPAEQPPAADTPPTASTAHPPADTAETPAAPHPQTPAASATEPAPATTEKPESAAAPEPEAAAQESTPAAPALTTPASKPAPTVARLNLPAGVLDVDWLLERPANHFTLQLLGVRSPDSLRAYLRDHAIPAPVAFFRTRLKGGDWYVIVQGDYPNMSAARAAVAELPAAVRKSKPWPRSFANVHTDIHKTHP